tara:strand:+ start:507 stop:1277 length:771 start_codon:yes stop_codon:yes gene_type:complete
LISEKNKPFNSKRNDTDFTIEEYCKILQIAKKEYKFVTYSNIPWSDRFILWRHDCDYSLNRSIKLARVEAAQGVSSTYFLNPHCEFYNLFESSQWKIIKDIISIGHEIGLHFDGTFYAIKTEKELDERIRYEADLLRDLFGTSPSAFSFHNPISKDFACEKEKYGGLINCYSARFKAEVPYCSDSNGYWRFRRLNDVLLDATDPCLQVLTHPGWWQEKAQSPWERICRSVDGRASSTLSNYEEQLKKDGRLNLGKD